MVVTRTHRGVYGYIESGGKVLLIIKKRGPYAGLFDLPGGSPEQGENEEETLSSEIKEETSCDLVSLSNRREYTVFFDAFKEDDGRPGCLEHTGIIFDCNVCGTADADISGLDSGGALWVDKNILSAENATPLVIMLRNASA
jgi:ADP-ribose pyrophosphatase YjhB (NUDIX family)